MVLAGRKTSPSHLITPSLIIPLASFELDEALIKGVNLWLSLQLLLQFAPPVRREGGGSFWFELRLRKENPEPDWHNVTNQLKKENLEPDRHNVANQLCPHSFPLWRAGEQLGKSNWWILKYALDRFSDLLASGIWRWVISSAFLRIRNPSDKGNFCTNWLRWHW